MNKEPTLTDLGEMIAHIVNHMATKDDIAELDTRLTSLDAKIDTVHAELKAKLDGINRRLDTDALQRTDANIPARMDAVERHLGLSRTITA